jgi:nucleoid-associated protein YgaU
MKITIFAGDGRRVFLLLATLCASMIGGTAIAQNEEAMSEADLVKLRLFIGEAVSSESVSNPSGSVVDGYYEVRPGDTLSEIMKSRLSGYGVNKRVLRDVIVDSNKKAFRRGNPHWLMAGARLKIPTRTEIMDYVVPGSGKMERKSPDELWVSFP